MIENAYLENCSFDEIKSLLVYRILKDIKDGIDKDEMVRFNDKKEKYMFGNINFLDILISEGLLTCFLASNFNDQLLINLTEEGEVYLHFHGQKNSR